VLRVDAQFATSAFGQHTVIGTIGVINGILGGVCPPFFAKVGTVTGASNGLQEQNPQAILRLGHG